MKDEDKTKEQLLNELMEMRQRVAELETADTERKRAEKEIKRRNRELAALNAIATTMMQSALGLDEMLQQIADGVVEGLGCNTALIFLPDEKEGVFKGGAVSTRGKIIERINAIVGFPLVQLKAPARSDFNETVSNVLDGRITIKHDLYELAGPALSKPVCSALQRLMGSKTFLSMPLLAKGKVVGGIFASTREELGEEDTETMMTFASQAAIAIENARLFEETRQRALQLQTVEEVGRMVSSILDPDELFPYVAKPIQQNFGYYHVDIFLVEPATGCAVFKASSDPAAEKVWKEQGLRFKIGEEGMIGWVAHTGEPLLANDVGQEPHYLPGELLPETKSELVVPLKVEERVVGVLDVNSDKPNAFNEDDVFVLQTLANQIAIAIENARLFEDTERWKAFNESVVQGIAEAILIEDAQGILTFANPAAEELLGYTREELIGRRWTIIVPEDEIEKVRQELAKRPQGTESRYETALLNKEGQVIPVTVSAQPLFEEGKFVGVLSAFTDIHERVRAEREIEERRLYLEVVLEAAPDAIVTLDAHHRIVEWNAGAEKLFGYSQEEVVGQNIDDLITSPDVFEEAARFTQMVMNEREVPPTETVRYRKDGSPVDVILAGSPILVGDELIGVVAVYTDITARKRMEETLRAMAFLDELTGLYNRRGFLILGQQQLKTANRMKSRMVLLFTDFNGLKRINDAFGHPEGDRALIEVANVLKETFRESDIIARFGGDEFVVLAIETDGASANVLTARLQENLEARNARRGRRYELSLSVGIASYDPEHPCSIDELVARADRAMYEQKQRNQQ